MPKSEILELLHLRLWRFDTYSQFISYFNYVCLQVVKHRWNVFIKANIPRINDVTEACISTVRPLKIGDFGFVYTKNAIMAAQGTIAFETIVCSQSLSYCIVFQNCQKKCQTWRDYGFFHHPCCLEHWCAALQTHAWPWVSCHSGSYLDFLDEAVCIATSYLFSHIDDIKSWHSGLMHQLWARYSWPSTLQDSAVRSQQVYESNEAILRKGNRRRMMGMSDIM